MAGPPMQGTTISGRYELGERLGSGGMSTVYKAADSVLERTVAVKVLAEHLSDDEKFVARFRREALAVARLIHPNVVQVYDTGVDEGRHYIVMEYVEGRSGAQLLRREGRLEPPVAAGIGIQACAGLEYAHRQGIVHRDVKPGNLMIVGAPATRDGGGAGAGARDMSVKLTDFGIARAAEQTRLTQVGSVVGTAAYLAPEQTRGEEATPGTDVYALGVVLYQLLTGRMPWEGATLAELAIRREGERPLPPRSYDEAIPEALSNVVLRALDNDPARRYASASALAEALRRGLAGEDTAAIEEGAPTGQLAGEATAPTRRLAGPAPEPRTPAQPLRPAPARPVHPAAAHPAPAAAPPTRRGRSFLGTLARVLGTLLLIAALAAIVVAVVLLVTEAGQQTDLGEILRDNLNDQIETLRDFIQQNTAQ